MNDELRKRRRIFILGKRTLIALFRALPKPAKDPLSIYEHFSFPTLDVDVPEDVVLIGVHYDFGRDSFMVSLAHPTWDVVLDGEEAPVVVEGPFVYLRRILPGEHGWKPA